MARYLHAEKLICLTKRMNHDNSKQIDHEVFNVTMQKVSSQFLSSPFILSQGYNTTLQDQLNFFNSSRFDGKEQKFRMKHMNTPLKQIKLITHLHKSLKMKKNHSFKITLLNPRKKPPQKALPLRIYD